VPAVPRSKQIRVIDLHFHCLPGIDDGPIDWSEAVELCRAAASEGTTALVATPHVLRDPWINDDPSERDRLILKLNTLLGGRPSVLAGCEYLFSWDAVALLEQGKSGPLTGLNRTKYLVLEFPSTFDWKRALDALHELSLLRAVAVIAHPERHRLFMREPQRLEELVGRGALVQLTAGSILGDFGDGPAIAGEEFYRRKLVHLVASDAHSLGRRPPRLAAAREWVRRSWGEDAARGIFAANPEAVLRSAPLPWTSGRWRETARNLRPFIAGRPGGGSG
jgi:protein-tyrosine phosphatase